MAHTLARAGEAGISAARLRHFFENALVSPVLTAHPTEVRRKSILDRELELAQLLDDRERIRLTPEEAKAIEEGLRRAVLTLWQTPMLRQTKLTVLDEVANGLSYYDYTFMRELPRLYAMLEDQLAEMVPHWQDLELPSFLRMGSWIGGDRDGNPFVTAEVLRETLRMQSTRVLSFYLGELHALGGELSLGTPNVSVSDDVMALAERDRCTARPSHIAGPFRASMRNWPRPREAS